MRKNKTKNKQTKNLPKILPTTLFTGIENVKYPSIA